MVLRSGAAKLPYVDLIVDHLSAFSDALRAQFTANGEQGVNVRHFWVDKLLPNNIAKEIQTGFPRPEGMHLIWSFRERKYSSKNFDEFDSTLKGITFAFQNPAVVRIIEKITGLKNQIPAASLYAGGLSVMRKGHFLNPHIDNSHNADGRYYRSLNLLYYVTPDWRVENGGNLELWDSQVRRHVTVPCLFNRLVVMETHPWSWHSVSPILKDVTRCCVSNYYFSAESPIGRPYTHVTSFNARPEQKARRALCRIDNRVRQGLRKLFPQGLGRTDVYAGKGN